MNLDLARTLAETLTQAVKQAEATGAIEIDLSDVLRAADDQARNELQAAIDAASKQQP